jgi:hypothetical protein
MRPITVQVGPFAAANAALIAASQTPASGVALTLTGSQPDTPRRIVVTAGSEAAQRTLVLTGTDRYGMTRSETITIPATTSGTYGSALDYASVTSIVPGQSFTAAVTVGTIATGSAGAPDVASSAWIRFDDYGFAPASLQVDVTNAGGTFTYTFETSLDDPNLVAPQTPVAMASMVWIADPNLTGQTSSKQDAIVARPLWGRLSVTAYTGNAFGTVTVSQPGGKFG